VGHQAFCYRQIASDRGDDLFALAQVFGVGNRAGGAQHLQLLQTQRDRRLRTPDESGRPWREREFDRRPVFARRSSLRSSGRISASRCGRQMNGSSSP
jgi:hypothetical protein